MTQTNNQISAKEALRLLNYWQNTKWEIDKQERDLERLKTQLLGEEDIYETIYNHIVYDSFENLIIEDFNDAFSGASEHLDIFYQSRGFSKDVLSKWLNDAKVSFDTKLEYDSFYGKKVPQTVISISIVKPKDEETHNKEIKDLENHIDNLKEKYENIKEELKQMNVIVT